MSGKYGIDFGTIAIKIFKKNTGLIFDAKNIIAIADANRVLQLAMKLLRCTERHLRIYRYHFRSNTV